MENEEGMRWGVKLSLSWAVAPVQQQVGWALIPGCCLSPRDRVGGLH